MDTTPALIIFNEPSQTPEETKLFIQKYHDRLVYGTDVSNKIEDSVRKANGRKTLIMDAFYEGIGTCRDRSHAVLGMSLEPHILEDIYWNNAHRFMEIRE